VLSDKQVLIAQQVYHVNQLRNYPLSVTDIEDWARSIDDLYPELEVNDLKEVILKFKKDEYIYDPSKGIQNIVNGLKKFTSFKGTIPDNKW